jgi:hypothetical protein
MPGEQISVPSAAAATSRPGGGRQTHQRHFLTYERTMDAPRAKIAGEQQNTED